MAPDAEEEVRIAVRSVLRLLGESPLRPERIAIGYRAASPYTRLLTEQLTAAGVPHHVPGGRRLAETVTGRLLVGLLQLERTGFPRADVLRWMSDGPVRDAQGKAVPHGRWDRRAREAGVSRGLDGWRSRLGTARADVGRRLDDCDDAGTRETYEQRRQDFDELLAFVEDLAAAATSVVTATSWPAVQQALPTALERFLG